MVTGPFTNFKHAFVTGATGILGVPLCRQLVAAGVAVTAYSRSSDVRRLPVEVRHVQGSIVDEVELRNAASGADLIFHVAAAVHGSVNTFREFEMVNVDGTVNVLKVASELKAKLVYVSTVNVAGYRSGDLADAYAATKSIAETKVVDAVASGLDAVIVRPATVYGNEIGRSGLIVDRLQSGSLKILPAPSRRISPVWSEDLARAMIAAVHLGKSGRNYTVAGPTLTTGEFVRRVCQSGEFKGPILSVQGWMFVIPLWLAWRLKSLTRWTPPISVESLLHGSTYDGLAAARDLGFDYSVIEDVFR